MATTNTNTVRVTKSQKLAAIRDMISADASVTFPAPVDKNGNTTKAPYVFDHAEIMKFFDEQLDQLARKNSSDKKQTEEQKQKEAYKADIIAYLATLPEFDDDDKPFPGATCTDVLKNVASLAGFQVQKPAALLKQLTTEGKVIPTSIKGRTYFKLA